LWQTEPISIILMLYNTCCSWCKISLIKATYMYRNMNTIDTQVGDCASHYEPLRISSTDTTLTDAWSHWWRHSRNAETCRILCVYRMHISVHVKFVW
jgi:hypothetical protein